MEYVVVERSVRGMKVNELAEIAYEGSREAGLGVTEHEGSRTGFYFSCHSASHPSHSLFVL